MLREILILLFVYTTSSYITHEKCNLKWHKASNKLNLPSQVFQGAARDRSIFFTRLLGSAKSRVDEISRGYKHSTLFEALKQFKYLYGDFCVPENFVIPTSDEWPEHLHGYAMGKGLQKSILKGVPKTYEVKFNSIGFYQNLRCVYNDWNVTYEALETYKQIYGDVSVNKSFTVPNSKEWPRLTRGMELGVKVYDIQHDIDYVKRYPDRAMLLNALGFSWDTYTTDSKDTSTYYDKENDCSDNSNVNTLFNIQYMKSSNTEFKKFYNALTQYKMMYNTVNNITMDYIVPHNDSRWDKSLWGYKLGQYVSMTYAVSNEQSVLYYKGAYHGKGDSDTISMLSQLGFSIVNESYANGMYSTCMHILIYMILIIYIYCIIVLYMFY
jgi:hypothetical protein